MKYAFLLVPALALSLSACTRNVTEDQNLTTMDFDLKSCLYGADEGENAQSVFLNQRDISTTSFGKEFNQALFNGIAKASVNSSLSFIRRTNVEVYKAPGYESQFCHQPLFKQGTELPEDIKEIWSRVTKRDGTEGWGITLGVYFGKGQANLESNTDKASIVIRENTSRWTLVHEFMHHLFQLRTTENGIDIEDIRAKFNTAAYRWNIYYEDLNSSRGVTERAKILIDLIDYSDLIAVNYDLEEMSIEKYMLEKFDQGKLKFVPKNSTGYIHANAEDALADYSKMIERAERVLSKAQQFNLESEKIQLQKRITLLNSRIKEIRAIMAAFPKPLKSMKLDENGLVGDDVNIHINCSHAAEGADISETIQNLK